jgi:hypothetical protein
MEINSDTKSGSRMLRTILTMRAVSVLYINGTSSMSPSETRYGGINDPSPSRLVGAVVAVKTIP